MIIMLYIKQDYLYVFVGNDRKKNKELQTFLFKEGYRWNKGSTYKHLSSATCIVIKKGSYYLKFNTGSKDWLGNRRNFILVDEFFTKYRSDNIRKISENYSI